MTQRMTVSAKALLMGTSTSRAHDGLIGQFGEGLPMALLVLARSGWEVVIYNGSEKWVPVIVKSPEYDGAKVLAIETRKMIKPREDFVIEIHNISSEEIDAIYSMFVKLDTRLQDVSRYYSRDQDKILTHPDYAQKLYIKGVFATNVNNLLFGYDLSFLSLNRDRKFVDVNLLSSSILNLLDDMITTSPTFCNFFVHHLFLIGQTDALETRHCWPLSSNTALQTLVKDTWFTYCPKNTIFCRNKDEVTKIENRGKQGYIIPELLYDIVNADISNAQTFKANSVRELRAVQAQHDKSTVPFHRKLLHIHTVACKIWPVLPEKIVFASLVSPYSPSYIDSDQNQIVLNVTQMPTSARDLIKVYFELIVTIPDVHQGNFSVHVISTLLADLIPE